MRKLFLPLFGLRVVLGKLAYRLHSHSKAPKRLFMDRRHNRALRKDRPHILIVRHLATHILDYNAHFLSWIRKHYPRINNRIKLGRNPGPTLDLKQTALLVHCLQDPLKEFDPRTYDRALKLEAECRERQIPIINPVQILSNSLKSKALEIIRQTGIRTAKIVPIPDPTKFDPDKHALSLPFFIREDTNVPGEVHFVGSRKDLKEVPWSKFKRPAALEFINVQSPDGYYRKFRYVMMGDSGVPRHLVISRNWFVKAPDRIHTIDNRREELDYLQSPQDPNHERLNQARKALGFDYVAFDYSYDQNGTLVVWEPNPFPYLWVPSGEGPACDYQQPTMHRLYKTLLLFYLKSAKLEDVIQTEGLEVY